jgi:hypothetical protein
LALLAGCSAPRAIAGPTSKPPEPAPATRSAAFGANIKEPRCSPETELSGPITACASWGGHSVCCRTGPSPRDHLVRTLRDHRAVRSCLLLAGVGSLDLAIQVGGDGWPTGVSVVDIVGSGEARCLDLIYDTRFMALGCRWDARYEWAVLVRE